MKDNAKGMKQETFADYVDAEKCVEYISRALSQVDILCQLAEECTEAAHAALKMARAISGSNPTPVTTSEALRVLNEELADINACCACLQGLDYGGMDITAVKKLNRWATRISERAAARGRI